MQLLGFLTRLFLGLILCLGPLNFFQISAWISMWSNYSQDFSTSTALEMTLSGEHPCELCLLIQEEREATEEAPTGPLPEQKQLRLDAFDRSAPLTSQPLSSQPKRSSPPGLIALLRPQTITLDLIPPPPDCSFLG